MLSQITHISLLVRDQEEALSWYVEKLGFEKRVDNPFPNGEARWLTIAPKGQQELEIVLQPPEWGPDGEAALRAELIGKIPGWVIITDDCRNEYEVLKGRGVRLLSPPEELPWGVSVVFEDLYGTVHNLLEPRQP